MSDEPNNKRSHTLSMVVLIVINVVLIVAFIVLVFFGPLFRVTPTSSRQQPAPVKTSFATGETAQFGKLQVTAPAVQRNWQSTNQFVLPAEGNEFILVTLNIKNASTKPIAVSPADFLLTTGDTAIGPTIKAIPSSPLGATEIKPAAELTGDIIYEIPKGSPKLTLQYQMYNTATQKPVVYSLTL